ncbi:MFS transporter [Vibrio xiamenensis]|nr:MFS transporter [Vibrio xiamenensis]
MELRIVKITIMDSKELIKRFGIQQGLHWLIVGIMIPVITLIFQSRGLSLRDIGFVMAVWIGSTAVFEIPLGGVADRYGRKNTYLVSLLLNSFACIVLYFAYHLALITLAAVLLGVARAVYSGTLDAWFYDRFQYTQGNGSYHSALAKINVVVTLGLAIGSLIGGWLPDIAKNSPFHLTSIYDLNIVIVCIANIGLIFVTWILVKEKTKQVKASSIDAKINIVKSSLDVLKKSLKHSVLSRLMQATLVFGMVLSSVENYWQPYLANVLQQTSYGVFVFGVISACYFLMSAASSLLSVPLLALFNSSHKSLMFTTRVLAGILCICLAYTTHLWSFTMCYLGFFFFFTLGNNSESVLLHENTAEQIRSTMLSISSVMVTCGGVLASLLFGVLSEDYGISVSWTVAGVLLIISSPVFVFMPEKQSLKTA